MLLSRILMFYFGGATSYQQLFTGMSLCLNIYDISCVLKNIEKTGKYYV